MIDSHKQKFLTYQKYINEEEIIMINNSSYCYPIVCASRLSEIAWLTNREINAIEYKLSVVFEEWQTSIFDAWTETYLRLKPQNLDMVRDKTVIKCINPMNVNRLVHDIYVFVSGAISKSIILHELIRTIYEWEKELFEDWKSVNGGAKDEERIF